jgi:uncharacterized protein (TIGR03000 family)
MPPAPAATPPPAVDATATPANDAERDAVRKLLLDLRKKPGADSGQPTSTPKGPAPARVTVKLPAQARLWVDQVECPLTSAERSFNTPTLELGQTYYYTLKMQIDQAGGPVTTSQRVLVSAGAQVNVTFTDPQAVATR